MYKLMIDETFPPESVDETQFNLKKTWRRVQELIRHFERIDSEFEFSQKNGTVRKAISKLKMWS